MNFKVGEYVRLKDEVDPYFNFIGKIISVSQYICRIKWLDFNKQSIEYKVNLERV